MVENWFERNTIRIDPDHIKVPLPHFQAKTLSGCGAAACRSIGAYYNIGPTKESHWRRLLKTNSGGTDPVVITQCLRNFGLTVRPKKYTEIDKLLESIDRGNPVLCPIQAYSSYRYYKHIFSGHWVIAIGYNDKYIIFEDSWVKRRRTYITYDQFMMRWFDVDRVGRYYPQLSLTIAGEPKKIVNLHLAQRIW